MDKNEFAELLRKSGCCFIDPSLDYRKELSQFRVNKHGDLLFMQNNRWEILIAKERLTECDWISHMIGKGHMDYGQFVCAYLKALELIGVKSLTIAIFGFSDSCRFSDE